MTGSSSPLRCCGSLVVGPWPVESPFDKVVGLDYYDGLLEGVASCAACGTLHVFSALAWEPEEDTRIYLLRRLPSTSLAEVLSTLSALGGARWPIWVPVWQFKDDTTAVSVRAGVDDLFRRVEAAGVIIASDPFLRHIDRARAIAAGYYAQRSVASWLIWLGETGWE